MIVVMYSFSVHAVQHETIYKGLYTLGHEVHTFQPCKEKEIFWVSFNWAGIEMQRYYKQSQVLPYQPMYVEFRGQILEELVGGFAQEYDGLIRLSDVKTFSFKIPDHCK